MHPGNRRCTAHSQRAVSLGDSWTRLARKYFHTQKERDITKHAHQHYDEHTIQNQQNIFNLCTHSWHGFAMEWAARVFLSLRSRKRGGKIFFFVVKRYQWWEQNVFETNDMARKITISVDFMVGIISPNYVRLTNRSGILIGRIHYR